jgi:hypothetical protein
MGSEIIYNLKWGFKYWYRLENKWASHSQEGSWAQVPVAHVCNPSYSGGRDHKDQGLKPDQANGSWGPMLKNTHHKKGLVEWLKM